MKQKIIIILSLLVFQQTYAFSGETLDSVADVVAWIILIALPAGGIYLFWQAHIYPEKVAEKKHHPQLQAIKTMCLLSLFFGGLLWPVALIWANYNYTKKDKNTEKEETTEDILAETPQEISVENISVQ
ncbi:DUF3302 domain-containing protein [Capnocytophaga canimorsus]|uniref:DUF3302 domain-containing protein n=1 Tax=Capnocytophaga canimorsus TaxID=28188 RepID=UPI00384F94A7